MSSAVAQFTCFSSLINNRRFQLQSRSFYSRKNVTTRKVLIVMSCSEGLGIELSDSENKTSASYIEDEPISRDGKFIYSPAVSESSNELFDEPVTSQPKKSAMIHDFCLGIPFGGLIVSGGLFGFIFSRNFGSLSMGLLVGGALLALSTLSLKVWRQGKSSLPFILGQAVLSLALVWKNYQAYALTKKLFPTGFNAVISAAMLCFYAYVVLSGGNPPPKKLKPLASAEPL